MCYNSCAACPSGTITGAEGSASCIACNSPKYQDGTRQTSCKTCATCAIDFVSVQPCGGPSAGRCDSCGINCGQCKSPDGCVGLTTEECDEKNRIQCLRSGCINSAYFHESRCYETCHDFGLFMHNDIENATTGGTCRARLGQRAGKLLFFFENDFFFFFSFFFDKSNNFCLFLFLQSSHSYTKLHPLWTLG